MEPFFLISIILQALAIYHVVRTGRSFIWIFVILFLSVLGVLIYAAVEILPNLNENMTARRAMRRMRETVDPGRELREAQLEHERNPSVDTASRLADALAHAGQPEEAIRVCEEARSGMFEDDPKLLLALTNAQFTAGHYTDAIATFDHVREKNPGFRSPDGHLIYARALEQSGQTDRALAEYETVAGYYPGAEARVRQALLHKKLGQQDKAQALLEAVLRDAKHSPKHYRKTQREWLDLAQRESSGGAAAEGGGR